MLENGEEGSGKMKGETPKSVTERTGCVTRTQRSHHFLITSVGCRVNLANGRVTCSCSMSVGNSFERTREIMSAERSNVLLLCRGSDTRDYVIIDC